MRWRRPVLTKARALLRIMKDKDLVRGARSIYWVLRRGQCVETSTPYLSRRGTHILASSCNRYHACARVQRTKCVLSHIALICSALIRTLSFLRPLSTVTFVAPAPFIFSSQGAELMLRWTQIVSLLSHLLYHSTRVTRCNCVLI